MQPNSSYPPAQEPDQNNEPPADRTPTSWDMTPRTQTSATPMVSQPTPAPQQPQSDFARYQPQPLQSADPVDTVRPMLEPITPSKVTYTEQEPDTVVQSTTPQSDVPQQPVPVSPVASDSAPGMQAAAIMQPQQVTQSLPQTAKPKKSRLGLIITSIVVAVLLLGGGVAAYVMNQPGTNKQPEIVTNTPVAAPVSDNEILNVLTGTHEEYLNQAIENHMKSTYVQQDYMIALGSPATMTIDIKGTSDLTNVKTPKSYVTFDMKHDLATAGELVLLGDNEKYAKLSKSAMVEMATNKTMPKLNQWYRVDALDLPAMQMYDPIRLNDLVNTPSGILLVGNFDSTVRKELMTYITDNKVYTVKSSADVVVDGQAMTHYSLTIDAKKVQDLNLKARTAVNGTYDISDDRFTQPADQTNEIWVDQKTGRIAKILLTTSSTGVKSTNETKISYPTTAASTIAKPANVLVAPAQ